MLLWHVRELFTDVNPLMAILLHIRNPIIDAIMHKYLPTTYYIKIYNIGQKIMGLRQRGKHRALDQCKCIQNQLDNHQSNLLSFIGNLTGDDVLLVGRSSLQ